MSGYQLYILVEAENRKEAIAAAKSELDSRREAGDLQEGDKGDVTSGGEVLNLKKCGGEAKLRELNKERKETANYYARQGLEAMVEAGCTGLGEVPLNEEKDTMVAYNLSIWAKIVAGYFSPHGVVYDPMTYQCGFTEDRIQELTASLRQMEKLWFVECIVG